MKPDETETRDTAQLPRAWDVRAAGNGGLAILYGDDRGGYMRAPIASFTTPADMLAWLSSAYDLPDPADAIPAGRDAGVFRDLRHHDQIRAFVESYEPREGCSCTFCNAVRTYRLGPSAKDVEEDLNDEAKEGQAHPDHKTLTIGRQAGVSTLRQETPRGEGMQGVPGGATPLALTEAQINHLVGRFLAWPLPKDFSPDAGISFEAEYNQNTPWPARHEPTGTNLFDARQATQMVRHMLEGLPS